MLRNFRRNIWPYFRNWNSPLNISALKLEVHNAMAHNEQFVENQQSAINDNINEIIQHRLEGEVHQIEDDGHISYVSERLLLATTVTAALGIGVILGVTGTLVYLASSQLGQPADLSIIPSIPGNLGTLEILCSESEITQSLKKVHEVIQSNPKIADIPLENLTTISFEDAAIDPYIADVCGDESIQSCTILDPLKNVFLEFMYSVKDVLGKQNIKISALRNWTINDFNCGTTSSSLGEIQNYNSPTMGSLVATGKYFSRNFCNALYECTIGAYIINPISHIRNMSKKYQAIRKLSVLV